jgi:hypothetical protein
MKHHLLCGYEYDNESFSETWEQFFLVWKIPECTLCLCLCSCMNLETIHITWHNRNWLYSLWKLEDKIVKNFPGWKQKTRVTPIYMPRNVHNEMHKTYLSSLCLAVERGIILRNPGIAEIQSLQHLDLHKVCPLAWRNHLLVCAESGESPLLVETEYSP